MEKELFEGIIKEMTDEYALKDLKYIQINFNNGINKYRYSTVKKDNEYLMFKLHEGNSWSYASKNLCESILRSNSHFMVESVELKYRKAFNSTPTVIITD